MTSAIDIGLLRPVAALALWSFVVWAWLYARRLPYIIRNRVPTERIATPEGIGAMLPEVVNRPSNNFRNLFELPVLFYVTCFGLTLVGATDGRAVALAWFYVALRVAHSLVHVIVNHVPLRFAIYVLSSLVLFALVWDFACQLFGWGR